MAEPKKRTKRPVSFEKKMQRLEKIVEELGDGGLPLASALKLFEEGQNLAGGCAKELDEAEKRIELLVHSRDGEQERQIEIGEEDDIAEVLDEQLDDD